MAILNEEEHHRQSERKLTENNSVGAALGKSNFCEIRVSAFNALALWSDPAWTSIQKGSSVHSRAVSEWVHHQRIWMAVNKVTIAEIVGSVRGVIPDSRLASYGDFRYDLDVEEMFDILDEIDEDFSQVGDGLSAIYESQNHKSSTQLTKSTETNENDYKEFLLKVVDEKRNDEKKLKNDWPKLDSADFEDWILKCQTLLSIVRRIVSHEKSFDEWSNLLLKTCSKFLSAVKSNTALLKVMEADVSLITDYKQLLSDPLTMLEILSLPQPFLDVRLNLDVRQEDNLWLKLSSPSIKKLWGHQQYDGQEKGFDSWLGTSNFLRRQRQKKTMMPKEDIEIPDVEARDLIGSLFNVIDGQDSVKLETFEAENKLDTPPNTKNYFPEAHGEWTRTLFPRRVNVPSEMNANIPSVGLGYFQHHTDRQALCRQNIAPVLPAVVFPPNLYLPPPPLPNTLHSQLNQKLPLYLSPTSQPLQSYKYEKVHLMLPRNHVTVSTPLANDAQQSQTTIQSFSLQHMAGANLHVQQVSRYYNQTASNFPLQTNLPSLYQEKQRYRIPDNILAMKSTQVCQTYFTTVDKNTTQYNENLIKEVMKNKLLPSISSRISTLNKLSFQAHELCQHNSGYSFQPKMISNKYRKSDFSSAQNALIDHPQHIIPKSTDLKQVERSSELKKVEEPNFSTRHKRAPLVTYNHQRSPVIQKLKKDSSPTFLFKQDLSCGLQKALAENFKKNELMKVENHSQKESKKYALDLKDLGNVINSKALNNSEASKQFQSGISAQYKNAQNSLLENQGTFSIFDHLHAKDEMSNLKNCHNVKKDQVNDKSMFNSKLKLTAGKKSSVKKNFRLYQFKILLLLCKKLKRHGDIAGIESIHKWIWDCIKLNKRDSSLIKGLWKLSTDSIILNYHSKKVVFRIPKSENRKSLKMGKNVSLSSFEEPKNKDHSATCDIFHLKDISNNHLNKSCVKIENDCDSINTCSQKEEKICSGRFYKLGYNATDQNPTSCIKDNKQLNVEFLNKMAENLFFNNELIAARQNSFRNENINGWTYFKIAIQMILKKASHILMNKRIDQQLMNHS